MPIEERIPGITVHPRNQCVVVIGELRTQPSGDCNKALAQDASARGGLEGVVALRHGLAIADHRHHPHVRLGIGIVVRDERDFDVQEGREVADQFGKCRFAVRTRYRQCGRMERLVRPTAFDLGNDAPGEDLQQRFGQRGIRDRLAVHRHQQPERGAAAVVQRIRGV